MGLRAHCHPLDRFVWSWGCTANFPALAPNGSISDKKEARKAIEPAKDAVENPAGVFDASTTDKDRPCLSIYLAP
jgi:hypothetical protein